MRFARFVFALFLVANFSGLILAGDWARFRGPNGTGVSEDGETPVTWSDSESLKWKVDLPGPGSSSPIVVGDRVFVTCYSGYGTDRRDPGEIENLKRHLVCVGRADGNVLWAKTVDAVQPEDPYRGMGVPEHGYASHTPVSDGEHVFAFFGKTGVLAFDMDGNQLWQVSVGTESGPRGWGSAASPIVYDDKVIVNASEEGEALVALDKKTGKEVWKAEASGLSDTWGTPVIVTVNGRQELVLGVPYEIWGFNPDTGKLAWYAETIPDNSLSASVVARGDTVYAIGGRSGAAVAVRAGGKGDVTDSHVVWTTSQRGRISTPVLYNDHIYWFTGGVANCIKADDGAEVFRSRLEGAPNSESGGGESGRRFGGSRGRDYASPVLAAGKIYAITRSGVTYVIAAKPEFEQLATNRFESDKSGFNATPAIADGQIYIRSNSTLYCVAENSRN